MYRKIKLLYFFIIIFIILEQFAFADEYTRSYKFKPIHIERNELLKVVSEIFLYVKDINGTVIKTNGHLELGGDGYSTDLSLPLDQNIYERFPRVSYDGYLYINAYNGMVSSVSFRLSDYSRELTVIGTNNDYVTGVIKVAQEKLWPYEYKFGGSWFRIILGSIFLFLSSLIVATYPSFFHIEEISYVILYVVSWILIYALIFIPPWSKIFPGFLVGIENRTFLEKNAPLFTFLALVFAIIIPILQIATNKIRKIKSK